MLRILCLLLLLCNPAYAVTVTVAGPTQTDIEDAIDAAGIGGTVIFPAATYAVVDLVADVIDQHWILEYGAIVQRAGGGALLTISASGLSIEGGLWDGARDSTVVSGLIGAGLKADNITLQNVAGWGIFILNGPMELRNSVISNTGFAGVLWQTTTTRDGPIIENITVNRTSGYVASGGILVQATVNGQWVSAPQLLRNRIILPVTSYYDAVGLEVIRGSAPLIFGNSVSYGRIGISVGLCRNARIIGNQAALAYSYNIEVAASSLWTIVQSNAAFSASGPGPSHGYGIRVSGASSNSKVLGNDTYWNSYSNVTIDADCVNCIQRDNN